MIRILQFSRHLPGRRQLLHTLKSRELDEPAYHKKPLDPQIVSLVKKYDSDIVYSSHIELNKKPLTYKQRTDLLYKLGSDDFLDRLNKARESEPSILVEKLIEFNDLKQNKDTPKAVIDKAEPITPRVEQTLSAEDEEKNARLAKAKLKILTEMGMRRSAIEYEIQSFPDNWMEDYETFDEGDFWADTQYGTPGKCSESVEVRLFFLFSFLFLNPNISVKCRLFLDPKVPISKVPCHGCGSNLHCADPSIPGYLPSELMSGHEKGVLKRLICQRCHFLKNYETALKVQVNVEDYVNMISQIKDKIALAILMVDLVDFPCSIWPNIVDIIGEKRPVIVVGNKVDLLPQDSKDYLNHITKRLEDALIETGLSKTNIKHTCLISAKTNYGIEDLITCLHTIWPNKGDVYLLGNANVGKSTLFNALLGSDYCRIRARNLIRRATSSLWPGTTLRMLKFPIARPSNALLYERRKRLMNEQRKQQAVESLRHSQIFTGRTPEKTLMEHIGKFEN